MSQSILNYGISVIKRNIPIEMLRLGFMERDTNYNRVISIDEKIISRILKPIVMMDLKLLGTIDYFINLNKATITSYITENDEYEYIIEVPDSLTGGKEIISAVSIISYPMKIIRPGTTSALTQASSALASQLVKAPVVGTNNVEIVGRNMVLINTGSMDISFADIYLECGLEVNDNLTHIGKKYYPKFGDLCVSAAKLYLHNKLLIKVDEGYIEGGHNINTIRSLVDRYESEGEKYRELIDKWVKIEVLNNRKFYDRFIENQIMPM